jgi:DNA mismatch repair ATPase MutL
MSSNKGLVPVIKKLDEVTVNRIAAGEVVQRPSAGIHDFSIIVFVFS